MIFLSNLLPTMIQLSENEKRLIFVILLAVILLLLLIGTIGYIIQKVIKLQGKKLEKAVYDAVVCGVITDVKHFKKYAIKKNNQIFFKQIWIPLILIVAGIIVLVVKGAIDGNFSYNPFNKVDGFGSLLYLWDFKDPSNYNMFFGINLLSKWPDLINEPHFVAEAWAGYISVPLLIVGAIWYIFVIQGFFARFIKIRYIIKTTFAKDLSKFNVNAAYANNVNNQNPQGAQAPQNPFFNPNNK